MAAPDESITWLLLRKVYHCVRKLRQYPTDRAAQIAIAEARRGKRLRMRAELREYVPRPDSRRVARLYSQSHFWKTSVGRIE